MASRDEPDTSRTSVKTYVPAYQKSEWQAHADELDMSQSEFVRTMVQAGRREFGIPDVPGGASTNGAERGDTPDTEGPDTDDEGNAVELEDRILAVLSDEQCLSWDELLDAVTDNIEERLETALQELQAGNEVQYSGRRGGYTLVESEHGD